MLYPLCISDVKGFLFCFTVYLSRKASWKDEFTIHHRKPKVQDLL